MHGGAGLQALATRDPRDRRRAAAGAPGYAAALEAAARPGWSPPRGPCTARATRGHPGQRRGVPRGRRARRRRLAVVGAAARGRRADRRVLRRQAQRGARTSSAGSCPAPARSSTCSTRWTPRCSTPRSDPRRPSGVSGCPERRPGTRVRVGRPRVGSGPVGVGRVERPRRLHAGRDVLPTEVVEQLQGLAGDRLQHPQRDSRSRRSINGTDWSHQQPGAGCVLGGVVDPEQHDAHLVEPQQARQPGASVRVGLDVRALDDLGHLATEPAGSARTPRRTGSSASAGRRRAGRTGPRTRGAAWRRPPRPRASR